MLVDHLSAYQNTFRTAIPQIELCFDGGVRPTTADPVMMRILAAGPHNKADYLVLDRFRFHAYSHRPCMVITNDGEIQEKIEQEGGSYLNVFDFVLLPHLTTPVFLPLQDLPVNKPGLKNQANQKRNPDINIELLGDPLTQFGRLKPPRKKPDRARPNLKVIPEPVPPPQDLAIPAPVEYVPGRPGQTGGEPAIYCLTIPSWPVNAGVRFLLASFCSTHRPQFINLLDNFDVSQLRPEDLTVLAEFLCSTCSAEPGFTHRGSLMDRVRLALLKAGDTGLDLAGLAAEIGLKPDGLGGRIKRKANGWLAILSVEERKGS